MKIASTTGAQVISVADAEIGLGRAPDGAETAAAELSSAGSSDSLRKPVRAGPVLILAFLVILSSLSDMFVRALTAAREHAEKGFRVLSLPVAI